MLSRRAVGFWMQRPMRASVRLAFWLARRILRCLAPLRGRRARFASGVFGGTSSLASSSATRAVSTSTCRVRTAIVSACDRTPADQCFPVEQFNRFAIHSKLQSVPPPRRESVHAPRVQSAARDHRTALILKPQKEGGEQILCLRSAQEPLTMSQGAPRQGRWIDLVVIKAHLSRGFHWNA